MGWGCLCCVLRTRFDQTYIFSCSTLVGKTCWNDNESSAQYIIIQLSLTFKHKKGRMWKHHGCSSHSVKDDGCSHTGQLICSEQTVWKCRKQSEAHWWVNTVVSKHSGAKETWKKSCQCSPWHRWLTAFTCRSLRQTPLLSLWLRLYTADMDNQTGGHGACVCLKLYTNGAVDHWILVKIKMFFFFF